MSFRFSFSSNSSSLSDHLCSRTTRVRERVLFFRTGPTRCARSMSSLVQVLEGWKLFSGLTTLCTHNEELNCTYLNKLCALRFTLCRQVHYVLSQLIILGLKRSKPFVERVDVVWQYCLVSIHFLKTSSHEVHHLSLKWFHLQNDASKSAGDAVSWGVLSVIAPLRRRTSLVSVPARR